MILETIVSTLNEDGTTNFAPIGAILEDDSVQFKLYAGSTTYKNLQARGEGVVNITDNVLYFVDADLRKNCKTVSSKKVKPYSLADTCEVWEFSVASFEVGEGNTPVALVKTCIKHRAEYKSFSGFCRAYGAVLEAAVALSRKHLLPKEFIQNSWVVWQDIVNKTGGLREKKAFEILTATFENH